jgi:hypothetical protein
MSHPVAIQFQTPDLDALPQLTGRIALLFDAEKPTSLAARRLNKLTRGALARALASDAVKALCKAQNIQIVTVADRRTATDDQIGDTQGQFGRFMAERGLQAMLVRPDFYLFGGASEFAVATVMPIVLDMCIFGIDLDPIAVELTKAALWLEIGVPDDAMMEDLIAAHCEARALPIGADGWRYLASRCERSHMGAARLVAVIDRLSLERKAPPGPAIWREALEEINGPVEPKLL